MSLRQDRCRLFGGVRKSIEHISDWFIVALRIYYVHNSPEHWFFCNVRRQDSYTRSRSKRSLACACACVRLQCFDLAASRQTGVHWLARLTCSRCRMSILYGRMSDGDRDVVWSPFCFPNPCVRLYCVSAWLRVCLCVCVCVCLCVRRVSVEKHRVSS